MPRVRVVTQTPAQQTAARQAAATATARGLGLRGVPASRTKPRKVFTKVEMRKMAKVSDLKVSKDVANFFRDESNVENQAATRFLGLVRMVNELGEGKRGRLASAPKIIKMHHKDAYFSACGLQSNPRKPRSTKPRTAITRAQEAALAAARAARRPAFQPKRGKVVVRGESMM